MSSNEPILEVNNLGCLLTKDRSIFHDVSFRLNAGDVLILQGKSGSGYEQIQLKLCVLESPAFNVFRTLENPPC